MNIYYIDAINLRSARATHSLRFLLLVMMTRSHRQCNMSLVRPSSALPLTPQRRCVCVLSAFDISSNWLNRYVTWFYLLTDLRILILISSCIAFIHIHTEISTRRSPSTPLSAHAQWLSMVMCTSRPVHLLAVQSPTSALCWPVCTSYIPFRITSMLSTSAWMKVSRALLVTFILLFESFFCSILSFKRHFYKLNCIMTKWIFILQILLSYFHTIL